MGFRLDRTYVLEFEGAMEGAYVKFRATPVGVALEIRGASDNQVTLPIDRAAELLAEYIQEWNLDDAKGEPLPITAEAILGGLEEVVIAKIMLEWYKAMRGLTAPLDPPGADGTLTDADMPMETATA